MRIASTGNPAKSFGLLALAVTGLLMAAPARAADHQTTISQSTFESRCRQMGGSLDTGGTAQIKICKLPGGQTVSCDFATSPAYCTSWRGAPVQDLLGPMVDTVQQAPGGKVGPKVDTAPGTVK